MLPFAQIPENYDGGYWYVIETTVQDIDGTPTIVLNTTSLDWCGWDFDIDGVKYYALRSPYVRPEVPESAVKISDILASSKPYGRNGGL